MRIEVTIMKQLLTTAYLFVVTIIAIVSFIAPTVSAQEKKTGQVNSPSAESRAGEFGRSISI